MVRIVAICLLGLWALSLTAAEGGAPTESGEAGGAVEGAPPAEAETEADAPDEQAEADDGAGEGPTAADLGDPAGWTTRTKASYLFGLLQLAPTIEQGKMVVDLVRRGLAARLAEEEPVVSRDEVPDLRRRWSELLATEAEVPAAAPVPEDAAEWNDRHKISYMFGYMAVIQSLEQGNLELAALRAGMADGVAGEEPRLPPEQARQVFQAYDQVLREEAAEAAEANIAKGKAYLAETAEKEGVQKTESGILYEVLEPGDGPKPGPTDTVRVHYHGQLIDGSVFDSSVERGEPISFPLDGVIPGWTEGLQLMPVGAKYRLHIPPELGYGAAGAGSGIPGNSVLVFEVELLGIE